MGIRFYCPNGHRLNVKDFLAGKRGICPHCQTRFRIPRESEIPKGSPKIKPGSVAEITGSPSPRRRSGSGTAILQAATVDKPVVVADVKEDENEDESIYVSDTDPIDESPESVWYIRPPAGGQYGPAKGDVVRRWIAEGRVSPDSLVWREGWTDWRLAGPIFPSITGLNAVKNQKNELEIEPEFVSSAAEITPQPSLPTPPKSQNAENRLLW